MLKNDNELEATKERIRYFQDQVEKLRQVETNPQNYRLSAGGYLAEIDRMNLEIREYLSLRPSELKEEAAGIEIASLVIDLSLVLMPSDDTTEIVSAIEDASAEIDQAIERMKKDQAEIDQLKAQTRAMLKELMAA